MPVLVQWLLRLGPLNPIAVRLVQSGSRRLRHFYVRTAYLAVLIIVLLWYLLISSSGGTLSYRELASAGASAFSYLAYLQVGLICILAPVFMAGAIAHEANPRTWDVLLATPLSGAQIVLGHLLGRLFFVVALLLASLPLFAITQYFGGVPGRSVLLTYLIAGSLALVVGAIAIALAVSRVAGRRAVFAFYATVVAYLFATWALDAALRARGLGAGPSGTGVTVLTALNPFLAVRALLSPSAYPRAAPGTVFGLTGLLLTRPVAVWCWGSVACSILLGAISTLTVRAGGLWAVVGGAPAARWRPRLPGVRGAEHRPPKPVWNNPIAWREAAARNRTIGRMLARWSFIGAGAAFGVALVAALHRGALAVADFQLALVATVGAETGVILLVAINMAATAVTREREDGTLDLILTTPITPGQYLAGKLRGLIAYLLPMLAVPVGTLALAGLYVLTDALGSGAPTAVNGVPIVFPEAALIYTLVTVPCAAFCCMVGLNFSLKSRGTIGSVVATVGVVGVVVGILGACAWSGGAQIPALGPALGAMSPLSTIVGVVYPNSAFAETMRLTDGPATTRTALAIGSALGAVAWSGITFAIHAAMVRTFDFTVRRLAGVR